MLYKGSFLLLSHPFLGLVCVCVCVLTDVMQSRSPPSPYVTEDDLELLIFLSEMLGLLVCTTVSDGCVLVKQSTTELDPAFKSGCQISVHSACF